jgi:hypothetical protein
MKPVPLKRQNRGETEFMENAPSSEKWQQWLEKNAGRLLLFARQQSRVPGDAEDVSDHPSAGD